MDTKKFEDGKRYENKIKTKFESEVYQFVKESGKLSAIMFKNTLKYELVNFIDKKKIDLKLDICYPIDPKNLKGIYTPYCHLELESNSNSTLQYFVESDFFNKHVIQYTSDVKFQSHNKVRECEKSTGIIEYQLKENELSKIIRIVKENYEQNKYSTIKKTKKSGELIERGSYLEKELKIKNTVDKERLLNIVRNIITKEDFKLIRTPNKIITDIYYDTSNNLLFNTGASFRLRKQQKLDGWISCLKTPSLENNNPITYDRTKIRSMIKNKELLKNGILGTNNKTSIAIQNYILTNNSKDLNPRLVVFQNRERYVVRPLPYEENGLFTEGYDLKASDMIHIIFDEVTAYDISDIKTDSLIMYGELDFTEKNFKKASFSSIEIESTGSNASSYVANKIFNQIEAKLTQNNYISQEIQNKYLISCKKLYSTD
ncbi:MULTISPECIES: hypothetical protein [Bacillus cereus group]|uniref:hypothetical protein n=1 Tax=Bacillus cereus group TaxID=86661 RepID=UPI0022E19E2B|nr:hypothetical protein [Bacillus paranthracis]